MSTSGKRRNFDNCHALHTRYLRTRIYKYNRHARHATRVYSVYNFSLLLVLLFYSLFVPGVAFQDCICNTRMRPSRAHRGVALPKRTLPVCTFLVSVISIIIRSTVACIILSFSEILGISLLPYHYAKLPQIELKS